MEMYPRELIASAINFSKAHSGSSDLADQDTSFSENADTEGKSQPSPLQASDNKNVSVLTLVINTV